jgi:hypothetical protein
MRTTLTVDEDVAIEIAEVVRREGRSLKSVVNDALRRGLLEMREPRKPSKPFKTKSYDLGEPLFPIDNIAEALAFAEGEDFK